MIPQNRIAEWTEGEATRELLSQVRRHRAALSQPGLSVYFPGEPQKTQDILSQISGAVDTWETIEALLEGDWTFFEDYDEEDDDE